MYYNQKAKFINILVTLYHALIQLFVSCNLVEQTFTTLCVFDPQVRVASDYLESSIRRDVSLFRDALRSADGPQSGQVGGRRSRFLVFSLIKGLFTSFITLGEVSGWAGKCFTREIKTICQSNLCYKKSKAIYLGFVVIFFYRV